MTELSPEAKRFVDEVRDLDDPSRADEARIRGALAAAIAAQGATIASGTAAAASGTGAVALKIALAGALVVGAASAVVYTVLPETRDEIADRRSTPPPVQQPTPAPEPEPESELEPAIEPESGIEPAPTPIEAARPIAPTPRVIAIEPPPPVVPVVTPPVTTPEEAPPADTLAEELELLRAANRALAADPAAALARVDEHRARFERGQLATDREVVRVLALCALGRTSDAHAIGDALRARLAGTTRGQRLDRSCIGGDGP